MSTIANLAVSLTANIGGFSAGMSTAARTLTGIRASFASATDSAANYERFINSLSGVKLAGADTLQSLRGVLDTARAEIQRFASNRDVKVAIEIGREHLDESWIRAKATLQRLAAASGLTVAAGVVGDKTRSLTAWLNQQRRRLTTPLMVRLGVSTDRIQSVIADVHARLESLRQYRAIRIVLAAANGATPVIRAVLRSLVPLTRLAARGIFVAIHATAAGVTAAVAKAKAALSSVGSFAGNMVSSVVRSFALIGFALGAVGGAGLVELVKGSMEAIAATGRLSDRLGITTEKMTGLQYAAKLAGIDSESLTTGLEHMLKNLSAAADKTTPAAAALAQMGLSAEQLTKEAPDKAFADIADGLKGIPNPADRARAAVEIFGKAGQALEPLMLQGAAGIKAAQAEAEKLGLTFSRTDAAKVELANQSFVKMQAVLTGVVQTLAIQVAPFIEALGNKLTALANNGQGVGKYIANGFASTLSTIAALSDYLAVVQAGWQLMRSAASFAIGGILDGMGYLIDGLNKLAEKLHITAIGGAESLHQLAAGFYDTGKDAFAKAGEDWKQFTDGTNAKAAARSIQDIQTASQSAAEGISKDAAAINTAGTATEDWAAKLKTAEENSKKVTETLGELHKAVETFGQTEGQKKLFDLKAMGASPEQIAEAQQAVDQLGKLENAKKAADAVAELQKQIDQVGMTDGQKRLSDLKLPGVDDATLEKLKTMADRLDALKEAHQVFESVQTPMEKYEQKIGKLSDLLNGGALDWETYSRGVRAARAELEKASQTKPPDLIASGSAAAQKYEYDLQHKTAFDDTPGASRQTAGKDEVGKLQLGEQQESRRILQRIENGLKDTNADPVQTLNIV